MIVVEDVFGRARSRHLDTEGAQARASDRLVRA
jgi:hypothetical protein